MKNVMMLLICVVATLCWSRGNSETNNTPKSVPLSESYNLSPDLKTHWKVEEKQFQGDKDTNGWSCILAIHNMPALSSQVPPICSVKIQNISSNILECWRGLFGETYSKIELLNSNGLPVEKTAAGKEIGTRLDDEKIKEMVKIRFKQWAAGRARTPGFVHIHPGQSCEIVFSLPELFQLSEEGQYTLKIKTGMIQKIGGEDYDPDLKTVWIPEVTTIFQMRLSNASLGKPPTNSFSK